jgi:hypothetical protein
MEWVRSQRQAGSMVGRALDPVQAAALGAVSQLYDVAPEQREAYIRGFMRGVAWAHEWPQDYIDKRWSGKPKRKPKPAPGPPEQLP